MEYTFVLNHTDVEEVARNTNEVFKNLFVSKQPSKREEVGYELIDDMVVIKYEQTEDERLVIDNMRIPHYTLAHLPVIFGAIVAHHRVIHLKVGAVVLTVNTVVNHPTGTYYSERDAVVGVTHHAIAGHIFKQHGNRYVALPDPALLKAIHRQVNLGVGQFIDPSLLVRFLLNEKPVYVPLAYCFHDPRVANALVKKVSATEWVGKRDEITTALSAVGGVK